MPLPSLAITEISPHPDFPFRPRFVIVTDREGCSRFGVRGVERLRDALLARLSPCDDANPASVSLAGFDDGGGTEFVIHVTLAESAVPADGIAQAIVVEAAMEVLAGEATGWQGPGWLGPKFRPTV